jgi:hypothetical protein
VTPCVASDIDDEAQRGVRVAVPDTLVEIGNRRQMQSPIWSRSRRVAYLSPNTSLAVPGRSSPDHSHRWRRQRRGLSYPERLVSDAAGIAGTPERDLHTDTKSSNEAKGCACLGYFRRRRRPAAADCTVSVMVLTMGLLTFQHCQNSGTSSRAAEIRTNDPVARCEVVASQSLWRIAVPLSLGSLHVLCTAASGPVRCRCTTATLGMMCTMRKPAFGLPCIRDRWR